MLAVFICISVCLWKYLYLVSGSRPLKNRSWFSQLRFPESKPQMWKYKPCIYKGWAVLSLCQWIFHLWVASWMLPSSYLRSWHVSVLGSLWKNYTWAWYEIGNCRVQGHSCPGFFAVTAQNRRVLALLRALVSRPSITLLFELPRASNISCHFQPVHVPLGKEIWKMDQIMSFGL